MTLNTFINLYIGLVVSYNRDLNPQYNFSITASWWGSMFANSFKFKPAKVHTQTWHSQFWDFLSVFSIESMVSVQCGLANSKSEGGLNYNWISKDQVWNYTFWLKKTSRLEPKLQSSLWQRLQRAPINTVYEDFANMLKKMVVLLNGFLIFCETYALLYHWWKYQENLWMQTENIIDFSKVVSFSTCTVRIPIVMQVMAVEGVTLLRFLFGMHPY